MNILITTPSFHGKGGVTVYFKSILPWLKGSTDFNITHLEIGGTGKSYKSFYPIIDQIKVYTNLKKSKIDLIHINLSLDPKSILRDSLFSFWAKQLRIPVLIFFRGWQISSESLFESKLAYFTKKVLLKADSYIVLASAFKKKLQEWGVNAPIYIETTNVDDKLISDFSIVSKVNRIKNSKNTKILFLARVEKDKGIFDTLDSINILLEKGHEVSLSIAGDGSAMRKVIEYLKENKVVCENTEILGYVRGEKKKSTYSSHDIYCLPTTHGEGMPNSVLEAMAFGLPVVTRPVGGIKDFFQNGKMGYITEKKDPEVIAKLIEKLILDKEKLTIMALYNHEYAKERFLASKVAIRIKQIYHKTLFADSA